MATTAELNYLIRVNDRDLKELKRNVDTVNKSVDKDLGSASTKADSHLRKIGQAATVGAAAGLAALGLAAKVGFGELMQAQKVTSQTEAVLKSTGGAANVTKGDVLGLADSLMHLSGVDDEAYQASENLLLTFTGIRNEAGKGNKIFDQTSRAIADMDEAMTHGNSTATSLHNTTILVGKALNDPIKGMGALRRVGVSLNESQQKTVQHLVETGHTMQAQKLILHELGKEFGGSAKAAGDTFAGKLSLAREEGKNFAGELVAGALPALTMLVEWLSKATDFMSKHQTTVKIVIAVLAGLALGVLAVRAAMAVYSAGAAVATAAQWAWNAAMDANPIGLVIIAIAALVAAIVIAYKSSGTFRDILLKVWGDIRHAANVFVDFFTKTVPGGFRAVLGWVRQHWPEIAVLLSGPFAPLVALATNGFGVRDRLIDAFKAVKGWFRETWSDVSGLISRPLSSIVDNASGGFGLKKAFDRAWSAIKGAMRTAFEGIGGAMAAVFKAPINAVLGAWNALRVPGFHVHINMPWPVPDVNFGWGGIDIPDIPQLARGGVAVRPTLAMIGEAGREAVIPLDRPGALEGAFGAAGPIVHIEHMTVSSPGDAQLVASAVNRALAFRR